MVLENWSKFRHSKYFPLCYNCLYSTCNKRIKAEVLCVEKQTKAVEC